MKNQERAARLKRMLESALLASTRHSGVKLSVVEIRASAIALAGVGRFIEAHELASSIPERKIRVWTLEGVSQAFCRFRKEENKPWRYDVNYLIEFGFFDSAREVARAAKNNYCLAFAEIYKTTRLPSDLEKIRRKADYNTFLDLLLSLVGELRSLEIVEEYRCSLVKIYGPKRHVILAGGFLDLYRIMRDPVDLVRVRAELRRVGRPDPLAAMKWETLFELTQNKDDKEEAKKIRRSLKIKKDRRILRTPEDCRTLSHFQAYADRIMNGRTNNSQVREIAALLDKMSRSGL